MSAALLNDVRRFIGRFVVLNDDQATAATLFAANTHVFNAFGCTPYLAITSPEKRSGKTQMLEVVELLVREPLPTANISDAALFRATDKLRPTLLIDEVDAVFGKKTRDREELRGLLCAGYRRGALAHRMGGNNNTTLQTFSVYCPKAFAGIGDCLPDTITDRSIPIRLKRRTRNEPLERFRRRDAEPGGLILRDRLADWLEPQHDYLAATRPALPDELDDRAQDVWEPLLAIADLAGWSEEARQAAIALSSGEEREDDSITALLLRDLQDVFEANGGRLRTADLLERLYEIEESPWGDWYGKPLSAHGLSRLLRPYRIRTMPVWVDGQTGRGYKVEQFADAFARVVGVRSVRNVRSECPSQKEPNSPNAPNSYHANGAILVVGDPGFPELLLERLNGGHITSAEASERLDLHNLIHRAGAAAA
jgi:Protein of unknown function (DUF3631)